MSDRYKNYVSVAERLNEAVPDITSIITDAPVMLTDAMGYIRATVALRDGATATGTASFRLDLQGKSAQATNPLEDCETSAVGRALGFLGYSSNRSIATREEVLEAQRRAEASYEPPRAPTAPVLAPTTPPQQPKPTNGHATTPEEARAKVFSTFASVIGGETWEALQAYMGPHYTAVAEPNTIEKWRLVYKAVQQEAARREYDAAEKTAAEGVTA